MTSIAGTRILRATIRLPILLSAICCASLGFAQSAAQDGDGRLSRKNLGSIETLIGGEIAARRIPGAVVLIQRQGKTVYLEAFGWRDEAKKVPMTTDTIFQVYSMTKPITTVAALMLVDDGKMRLNDPVSKFLPAFADTKVGIERRNAQGQLVLELVPQEVPMTIEDLMRHSSGITTGWYGDSLVRKAYAASDLYEGDFDNAQFAERIARLPLAEQPGTEWDYGLSTDVLGRVIEVVSGQSLYDFEKQRLLDPLGMKDTAYRVLDPARQRLLAQLLPDDSIVRNAFPRNPRVMRKFESGSGGLVSTVSDYARFCEMILRGGELDGRRYLKPATFEIMASNQLWPESNVNPSAYYFPGDGFGFGLGFAVRTARGVANPPGSVGELKWDGALGTYFWIDPKEDMFVILMMQTPTHAERIKPMLKRAIYDAFEN
jgi:CubicO group peptidase (beta-lactamase class C family)